MKTVGVLVPAPCVDFVRKQLVDIPGVVTWQLHPVSRDNTSEDVTLACVSQTAGAAQCDGFLNLCNGRRSDRVSAPEVVATLNEMRVQYYSGVTLQASKYTRSDVSALTFYAAEDNKDGLVSPSHGIVHSHQQRGYIEQLNNNKIVQENGNNGNGSNGHTVDKKTPSVNMVDLLKFPVSVRPLRYLHTEQTGDGEMICNSIAERIAAQGFFFQQGHAAVLVQEQQARDDATDVDILGFATAVYPEANADAKQQPQQVVKVMLEPSSKLSSDDTAHLTKISEKLFRGIFDDATCCSPLRGHCLFRFIGRKQQQQQQDGVHCWTWRVDEIVPNCNIFLPIANDAASSSSSSRIMDAVLLPAFNNDRVALSKLMLELVGFHGPPRYVAPAFKVEFDPRYNWYGVVAARDLKKGDIVFADEATSFTLVTKPFVEAHWSDEMKVVFSRYAWPLSGPERVQSKTGGDDQLCDADQHVYAIWSDDPAKWRPINHHCDPNLVFAVPHSLNCIAARDIPQGEILSLDYATFCDRTMKPFQCACGAGEGKCRGLIEPTVEALRKYGLNSWHRSIPAKCATMGVPK